MFQEMWNLFLDRNDFFVGLLWEHLGISLLAILIAVLIGGLAGIGMREVQGSASTTL